MEAVNENDEILGFLRLLINKPQAIIREIRVYGSMKKINSYDLLGIQHSGVGKKLIENAEFISKEAFCKELLVNSGIGVKEYFEKLSFNDTRGTYMRLKNIS